MPLRKILIQGRLSSLVLVRQLILEKENSEVPPVVFYLKIDLVSFLICDEEVRQSIREKTNCTLLKSLPCVTSHSLWKVEFIHTL